jgi:cation:H+ antiporter
MLIHIFRFVLSSCFIVLAGYYLTKFADKIAESTGWGRMFVGSLLLAGATSLPELMVDIKAVRLDLPDLAVGDLLGSCLINLLILALLDFIFPSTFRRTAFSPKNIHHSLSAVLTIILASIIGLGIVAQIELSFLGINLVCWSLLIVYLYGLRLIYNERQELGDIEGEKNLLQKINLKPIIVAFSGYFSCALVILLTAPFLVQAADDLARLSGLGHTFIGTTLVAFATSLPELVATLSAFKMGVPDLALGNIFGSNTFNMVLFVPLDFMYIKNIFSSVNPLHLVTVLGIIISTSIAVAGQLYRKKHQSRFTEPSSELVVTVIFIFLFLIYYIK